MAASIGTMFGKIGALLGNILIGIFIDAHCIVPIFVSSSFLIGEYKFGIVPTQWFNLRTYSYLDLK